MIIIDKTNRKRWSTLKRKIAISKMLDGNNVIKYMLSINLMLNKFKQVKSCFHKKRDYITKIIPKYDRD